MKFTITSFVGVLLISLQAISQNTPQVSSKVATLRRQLLECRQDKEQLTNENTNLHSYQGQLLKTVSNVRDSLNLFVGKTTSLANEVAKLNGQNRGLTASVKDANDEVKATQEKLKKANYEIDILQNPLIVRVYDMDLESLKQAITARLSEASLGFQFDEDVNNQFKISKSFDGNAEAWWVFDKTIDVLLEMNMRLEPHQFDKNRTLVYNSTNLLEKVRFSNKQFALQEDKDKVRLYQEKAMRVLEANIRKNTNK